MMMEIYIYTHTTKLLRILKMSFILSLSLYYSLYDSLYMMIDDGDDENGDDDDCSIAVFVVQQNITKI